MKTAYRSKSECWLFMLVIPTPKKLNEKSLLSKDSQGSIQWQAFNSCLTNRCKQAEECPKFSGTIFSTLQDSCIFLELCSVSLSTIFGACKFSCFYRFPWIYVINNVFRVKGTNFYTCGKEVPYDKHFRVAWLYQTQFSKFISV